MDSALFSGLILGLTLLLLLAALLGWFLSRQMRAYRQAQLLLVRSDAEWKKAHAIIALWQPRTEAPSWQRRWRHLEAEYHRRAAEEALTQQRYEEGLDQVRRVAALREQDAASHEERVVETMLAEARRLMASLANTDQAAAAPLLARVLLVRTACPEASFWLGLSHFRAGQADLAVQVLTQAQGEVGQHFLDPALYLGAVLLRQGRAQEALRHLAEANRIDRTCPFVAWQLGLALVAAGGDSRVAIQALQRALTRFAPSGTPPNAAAPNSKPNPLQQAWLDGLPEGKSFVRSLALKHPFACPVFGNDLAAIVRQGQLALAQAQYRIGHFAEAAETYTRLLQESPPTVGLLRGLGLAQARLGQYEQAVKHLRTALDQENPPQPFTVGYLALSAALGPPAEPEDRPRNVEWAIRQLARFDLQGNAEWAGLMNRVFAEARTCHVAVAVEDQVRLCGTLVSVEAVDPAAAAAYDHLAATAPTAVQSEHAWLFAHAAQQHDCRGTRDLDLLGRTLGERLRARPFFEQRRWDFDEVEYLFLRRWAGRHTADYADSSSPTGPLGLEVCPAWQRKLLERSRRLELSGQVAAARDTAEVLLALAPTSSSAHDRLAFLCYQQADRANAAQVLKTWHELEPNNSVPLIRLAVVDQQRGESAASLQAIRAALDLTHGTARADVAFLGARLALHNGLGQMEECVRARQTAADLLRECLKEDPVHFQALWHLAALHCWAGETDQLAGLAGAMVHPEVDEPRFHLLAAVCHLAAQDPLKALAAAERAWTDPTLTGDCHYLAGLALLHSRDETVAVTHLEKAIRTDCPSAAAAKALLGTLCLRRHDAEAALRWWERLTAEERGLLNLDGVYRPARLVAGLQALTAGDPERAVERMRVLDEAEAFSADAPPFLVQALAKAGRQLYYQAVRALPGAPEANAQWTRAASYLADHQKAVGPTRETSYLLAMARKRLGKVADAEATLEQITDPDVEVLFQRGLLSVRRGHLDQAEKLFLRVRELDPNCFATAYNLLWTRLSLNHLAPAAALLGPTGPLAPTDGDRRMLSALQALMERAAQFPEPLTFEQEHRLLNSIKGLANLEVTQRLLGNWAPFGPTDARDAHREVVLVRARNLVERGRWDEALPLLRPAARMLEGGDRATAASLLCLLGCCACLNQDFEDGLDHFEIALRLSLGASPSSASSSTDVRLHQNLALVQEQLRQHAKADEHWNRVFDLVEESSESVLEEADRRAYLKALAVEALTRRANYYAEREKWQTALDFLRRAHRLRPADTEVAERMFHYCQHLRRREEALAVLRQLRETCPERSQYELYEADLLEVKNLTDVERKLHEIDRVAQRHADDARVQSRARDMVEQTIPTMRGLADQLSEQLAKVLHQVDNLPGYQINWKAVHDVMADLLRDYKKLRGLANQCLPLVGETGKRGLRQFTEHVEQQIAECRSLADS